MPFPRGLLPTAAVLAAAVAVAGCSTPSTPDSGRDKSQLTLADAYEPESLNPLLGYGEEGVSKIFDGLLTYRADRTLEPALAAEPPQPSADGRSWTVKLRKDVRFHDGSTFGAEDVVATYRAALDPAYASTVRSGLSMISKVEQVDPLTVRFDLAHPYAPFGHKLVLGVLPSEALAKPEPQDRSPMGTKPVGTGPFRLAEWRKGERMVLEANDSYWHGTPKIRKVNVVFAVDDNTRAQRMRGGEFDGGPLPPNLAKTFEGLDGYRVVTHKSADYRTVVMPTANPVTGDKAMRLALNLAMNRQGMIDALLGGKGAPASTLIPQALPEFVEPSAQFRYDRAEAERTLEAAGWVKGADGVRARDGQRAKFSLLYPAGDNVRKDLAQAFASDAKAVGVEVVLEGLGWEAIEPRMGNDALVLGGGNPLDPDLKSYPLLHSSYAANGFNNPGSYRNAEVDAALEAGRRTTDPAQRVVAYKQFQRAYVADPGMVFLTFLDHTYVVREGWTGYQEVVEPHTHGFTWGPWWNLQDWAPRR
ncbi:ABC transporter substrate-binding protein [Streptoalloteichus hindustanus]|uniref:Peptide/nickel transport system substrate-binding protein n=1 Tax=Streptoalloteichus hindustanus TaxID=2017 RepID=A0A1M5ARC4_STRHI|nr:ABC transporter substrate-binding protein [Streptoalloteichus hindustanus]SHF32735.1 peptide/nickel transport system substrate-binding protein [Streptoalloteichus hindustanus]